MQSLIKSASKSHLAAKIDEVAVDTLMEIDNNMRSNIDLILELTKGMKDKKGDNHQIKGRESIIDKNRLFSTHDEPDKQQNYQCAQKVIPAFNYVRECENLTQNNKLTKSPSATSGLNLLSSNDFKKICSGNNLMKSGSFVNLYNHINDIQSLAITESIRSLSRNGSSASLCELVKEVSSTARPEITITEDSVTNIREATCAAGLAVNEVGNQFIEIHQKAYFSI
uniref:Uncharacterized protein n=1 Tax=Rhabditophanes sp. KR3021 TaxID=114890 RepID=A0AC35U997_9BILA